MDMTSGEFEPYFLTNRDESTRIALNEDALKEDEETFEHTDEERGFKLVLTYDDPAKQWALTVNGQNVDEMEAAPRQVLSVARQNCEINFEG